jgi:hypothetical protein
MPSQVVEYVIHEVGHQLLEQILVLSAEQVARRQDSGQSQRRHAIEPN